MAAAANLKLTPVQCNMVHNNEIWKAHVHHEHVAAKNWPQTWGFVSDYYKQLRREILVTRQQWYTNEDEAEMMKNGDPKSPEQSALKLPPLPLPKQDDTNPFPITSAREVGWKSGQRELNLEVYGRQARGNKSIHKHLNWPHDAVP